MKPNQGGYELVDILVLTLGPAEELLPVEERVAATAEVALQFGDNSVDIVVDLNVQSSSLPKDCPVRVQRGAEETLAGREDLDAVHGPSEGQVIGPAGAQSVNDVKSLSSGLERIGTSIFHGRADVTRGVSDEVTEGCRSVDRTKSTRVAIICCCWWSSCAIPGAGVSMSGAPDRS